MNPPTNEVYSSVYSESIEQKILPLACGHQLLETFRTPSQVCLCPKPGVLPTLSFRFIMSCVWVSIYNEMKSFKTYSNAGTSIFSFPCLSHTYLLPAGVIWMQWECFLPPTFLLLKTSHSKTRWTFSTELKCLLRNVYTVFNVHVLATI